MEPNFGLGEGEQLWLMLRTSSSLHYTERNEHILAANFQTPVF